KSYNGAISITPEYEPCGTVLEAAKRAGYATGLVVTTDITDATPACFASHVLTRAMNDDIALQEVGDGPLGRVVDLMLGGGRCHFLPNGTADSCRLDETDVNINDDSESNSDNGHSPSSGGSNRLREVLLFVWALLATAAVIVLAVWSQHNRQTGHGTGPTPEKRNLIFMVSDGMGPASLSLTRSFRQHVEGLPEDDTLTLDKHFW
ncbi:hypothetical protein BN1723_017402, partial [Verticillium longisporum]